MKTIGIKLADGSFYPVLKEGSPSERLLELTTAHNNQTKVMVDLYRSELESMEDAEYVDSLQIEDLNEHPNGEPTLTFTVSIDENNKLSAKMVDNETGLQSNATITLVSRTLEERLLPDEYAIKDPTIEGVSLSETEENALFGNDDNEESEADQSIDFNFDPDLPDFNESAPESPNPDESALKSEPDVINEFDTPVEETAVSEEENTLPEPELSPTSSELDSIRDQLVAEPDEADIGEITQEAVSDEFELPPMSDFNPLDEPVLEDDALTIDEFDQPQSETEEAPAEDNPAEEETYAEDATIISEEPAVEEPVSEETSEQTFTDTADATEEAVVEDFSADDVPDEDISSNPLDLSFDIPEEKPQNSIDEAETSTESAALSGDFDLPDTKTDSNSLDDLDLPDFDSSFETNFDTDSSNLSTGDSELNLSDSFDSTEPEPSTSDVFNTDDLDFGDLDSTLASSDSSASDNSNAYLDDLDFDDLDSSTSSQPAGKGLSFTGLYDKETAMGNSAASDNDERKNPKAAVIICILCAIICVLATLFVLMVLTPNFKNFGKKDKAETQVTAAELPDLRPAEAQEAEKTPEPEPMPAPEPLPPVPQAQEEEVVVIENAEDVVPLPPPVTPVKPKDINYKIKWGDTLWDISDTYYKNPWRYKYIARYNGIKNPDYIISGTYITIPAE